MRKLLSVLFCLVLLSLPALAQDDGSDLMAGYRLGKFHATASMLAHDLTMVLALVDETGLADITSENYAEGVIGDEDLETANLVLAYGIWRCQFMILPVCEGGLDSESFDHPAMAEFRDPTFDILSGVKADAEAFMEIVDYEGLVAFCDAVRDGQYVEDLLLLAEMAATNAGEI